MAVAADFRSEMDQRRRWIAPAVILLALALAAWFMWRLVNQRGGVAKPEAPQTQVNLLPPPPPTPPPPPQEQPPPKPEPINQPTPAPTPAPQTPQAPAPVSIAGPAQAGTDAFGVQSGNGGGNGAPGSIGTCLGSNCGQGGGGVGDAFYRRYLGSALEAALRSDKRVNRKTFNVTVLIWVSPSGAVTRADMVRGTGDDRLDQSVAASLKDVAALDAPTSIRFPQTVVVRGTRGI